MPDTLTLPFIPKGASHQAFSPDVSPAGSNMLLNKRSRSFQGFSPRESKDASPSKAVRVEDDRLPQDEDASPLGSALRAARRARAYGSASAEQEEELSKDEDSSPLGSSLRAIRRGRAFGGEVVGAGAEVQSPEADESPLGDALRAIRRAHAFGGDVAAARAKLDTETFEADAENSPIGSRLRAVRRARAYGVASPLLAVPA